MTESPLLHVRKYQRGEEAALRRLFLDTVHAVNIRDYTAEQVQAWAPEDLDEQEWRGRIERNDPYVCLHQRTIVGFADLQATGHIDQFYVHCQWQRRGVGRRLMHTIEAVARQQRLSALSADVSITARAFFESHCFRVLAAQEVSRRGVELTNFHMVRRLAEP